MSFQLSLNCGNPQCFLPGLAICSVCRAEVYCGASCQRIHWTSHKLLCTNVPEEVVVVPPDSLRQHGKSDSNSLKLAIDEMQFQLERFRNANIQGLAKYNNGQYLTALALFTEAKDLVGTALGPQSLICGKMTCLAALSLGKLNRYDEALQHIKQGIHIFESLVDTGNKSAIPSLEDANCTCVHLLLSSGDLVSAEDKCVEQLGLVEKVHGWEHANILPWLDAMATLRSAQGRLEEAMELVTHGAIVATNTFGTVHPEVQRAVLRLAKLHFAMGNIPAAVRVAEANYRDLLQLPPPSPPKGLKRIRDDNDDLDEQCCIDLTEKTNERLSAEADGAMVLGQVYQAGGQLLDAEKMYRAALLVKDESLASSTTGCQQVDFDVGDVLDRLASVLVALNRLDDDTEHTLRRALQTHEDTRDKILHAEDTVGVVDFAADGHGDGRHHHRQWNLKIASTMANLGCVLGRRGSFAEAKRLCVRSCEMVEAVCGPQDPVLARALVAFADVSLQEGKETGTVDITCYEETSDTEEELTETSYDDGDDKEVEVETMLLRARNILRGDPSADPALLTEIEEYLSEIGRRRRRRPKRQRQRSARTETEVEIRIIGMNNTDLKSDTSIAESGSTAESGSESGSGL
eukprot:gene11377-23815_t